MGIRQVAPQAKATECLGMRAASEAGGACTSANRDRQRAVGCHGDHGTWTIPPCWAATSFGLTRQGRILPRQF